jgi:hypothetical protein
MALRTSSFCRTSGCGRFPSRSKRSIRRCASWSTTCSRPCTTPRASGLPRSRSASRRRVVTIDLAKKDEPRAPQVFINPESPGSEEKKVYEEGCLSIPEYYEEVERPAEVRVHEISRPRRQDASRSRPSRGLLATCLPARDRPPQRRAVHRPHSDDEAQARPCSRSRPMSRMILLTNKEIYRPVPDPDRPDGLAHRRDCVDSRSCGGNPEFSGL